MLIDGNLTLVHKGYALGGSTGTVHYISDAETTEAVTSANDENMVLDIGVGRQVGRGRTPYLVISANDTGGGGSDDEFGFELYTSDAGIQTDGTIGNTANPAVQIGRVRMPGDVPAGASRWIALPDDTGAFLQLRYNTTAEATENLKFSAFVSTELPTTTHITRADYVGWESYSGGGGYGRAQDNTSS